MKEKTKNLFNVKNIINIVLLLSLVFIYIKKEVDNDLFFDIKTGESILKYGIDFKDHFSFIPNLTYLYHHWLYDLIIFNIYKYFGLIGCHVLIVIIFSIFALVFFNTCKKYTKSLILPFLFTAFVVYKVGYNFSMRVQSFTYLLFLLEVIQIEKIYQGNKKYLPTLILTSILILNLHMPLWILTIVLFLPFLFEGTLSLICDKFDKFNKIISKYFKIERPKNYRLLYISFLLLFISGLLTPLKLNAYTFFIKVYSSYGYDILKIGELTKTPLIENKYLIVFLSIFILGIYTKVLDVKLRDFILTIGLFIFGMIALRNIVFITIIFPLVIIKSIKKQPNFDFINKITNKINVKLFSYSILLLSTFVYIMCIKTFDYKNQDFYVSIDYPVEITKYIKENLDYKNIKLYNEFNYGSYLEFNDIPVFIDSRAEVYIKDFNGGKDIAGDAVKMEKVSTYKSIIKKYDFDYLLTYSDSQLSYLLKNDKHFSLVVEEPTVLEEGYSSRYSLYKVNEKLNN